VSRCNFDLIHEFVNQIIQPGVKILHISVFTKILAAHLVIFLSSCQKL
jgi:hypothetical protein